MTGTRPTGPLDPLPAWISPELMAAAVGLLLWGSVLAASLLGGRGIGIGSTPGSSTGPLATPDVAERPDRAALAVAQLVGRRLQASGVELEGVLAEPSLDPAAVETALRDMTAQLGLGSDVVRQLGDSALTKDLMTDLAATYADLQRAIDAALAAPSTDVAGVAKAAAMVLAVLDRLAIIGGRVDEMLAGGPDPGPVAVASSSPSPSPGASAGPDASADPSPGTSPGVSSGPTRNDLRDPGFELTPISAWSLLVASPAEADLVSDPLDPAGGSRSARVEILSGSDARGGIALVQDGITLEAGRRYRVTVHARADRPREFRVSVGSAGGETYAARVFTAGTAWEGYDLDFVAIVGDPVASLRFELGRSAVTAWFDDAGITPVAD